MIKPAALLDALIKMLNKEMDELLVSTWFTGAEALCVSDGCFYIYVESEMGRDTLNNHFSQNVSTLLYEITGEALSPCYICDKQERAKLRALGNDSPYSFYTFENFIVGSSNKFAHAAAMAVAREPAALYNPLFIYGGSGLGKTHLLYAIAGELKKSDPHANVTYVNGDDFTNEFVESIREGKMPEFRAKYRSSDLLLLDDIQFIAGRIETQNEFFHTFNALHEAHKQIVLTSDRPPKEIATLEERLRTRFEWGLLADIQSPDDATRLAIIKAKSELLGLMLPQNIVDYIASTITSNVRQLEGAVKKIGAMHSLMGRTIDMELAEEAIRDILKENPGLHPTPKLILEEVSSFFSVPLDKLTGNAKTQNVVLPRQIAMYLMRTLTDLSFPAIGKFMGKDHSTVKYTTDKLERQLGSDPELQNMISDLRQNITSR